MKKCIFILSPSFPVVSNKLIQYFSISSNGHHKLQLGGKLINYIYTYIHIYILSVSLLSYMYYCIYGYFFEVFSQKVEFVFLEAHLSSLISYQVQSPNRFDHLSLCPPNLRNISPSLLPGVSLFYESVHDLSSLHSEKHNPS